MKIERVYQCDTTHVYYFLVRLYTLVLSRLRNFQIKDVWVRI